MVKVKVSDITISYVDTIPLRSMTALHHPTGISIDVVQDSKVGYSRYRLQNKTFAEIRQKLSEYYNDTVVFEY